MFEPLLWFILSAGLQTPAAPSSPQAQPKFGLIEITTTITYPNVGSSGPGPRTTKSRMCITPQTVPPELVGKASHLCTSSNVVQEAGHRSMDLTCQGIFSHVDTQTISPDFTRTSIHAIITNQGHTTAVDSTSEYRFVSSSCGSVQPGQVIPVQ